MATFNLWAQLSNFFFTKAGSVNGQIWAPSNGANGDFPIWVDTYTADTAQPGALETYTIVLTSQDWVGAQQPEITVATTTLINPFAGLNGIGNLAAPVSFGGGQGGVISWQASAVAGEYDVKFQGFTTQMVTAPSAGPNTSLTGATVTLEADIAKPTSWSDTTNGSSFVLGYTTQATATTFNLWLRAYNTSGGALSPLVEAYKNAGVNQVAFLLGEAPGAYFFNYAIAGSGWFVRAFDPNTGAFGAPTEFVALSAYSEVFGISANVLSDGSRVRFVSGVESGKQVIQVFKGGALATTIGLTGQTADHWQITSILDPVNNTADYTVLAYTDAGQVHLDLFGANGVEIGATVIVPGLTSFDRIHGLTGGRTGRVEIDYTVANPNGGTEIQGRIYDTATSGYVYTLGANNEFIGSTFNDTITDSTGVYFVNGGGGVDTFVVNASSSVVTFTTGDRQDIVVSQGPGSFATLERFTNISLSDEMVTINGSRITLGFGGLFRAGAPLAAKYSFAFGAGGGEIEELSGSSLGASLAAWGAGDFVKFDAANFAAGDKLKFVASTQGGVLELVNASGGAVDANLFHVLSGMLSTAEFSLVPETHGFGVKFA